MRTLKSGVRFVESLVWSHICATFGCGVRLVGFLIWSHNMEPLVMCQPCVAFVLDTNVRNFRSAVIFLCL